MIPLAIVQARIGSTRLPGKMLLPVGSKPLIWYAWHAASRAFGTENTVTAIPATPENDELASVVSKFGGPVFRWDGPEEDVLGRFFHCANRYRWHPHTQIVRITPDDPHKKPSLLREVAKGVRHPVVFSGDAFTLEQLNIVHSQLPADDERREHLGLLYPVDAPEPPYGVWTVDTREDYELVCARMTMQVRV